MTEIEKELERFIASGKATKKDNSGRYQITYIDPLKIAKHFVQWQKEQMMKGAVDGEVNIWGSHISLPKVLPSEFSKQRVKVIIIKE